MWLFTTQGFYSVVEDRDDPNGVLVRTRVRKDLEALAEQIPGSEIQETLNPDYDYGWRAFVTRDQWREAVAQLASTIDYDNFKNAVADRQGHDRADAYLPIWSQLQRLQHRGG